MFQHAMPPHLTAYEIEDARAISDRLQSIGQFVLRYGLVLVIGWIGALAFTAYEAAEVESLVASSPLMGWMYRFLSVQEVSDLLGIVESTRAVMIALRPVSAKVSALGSLFPGALSKVSEGRRRDVFQAEHLRDPSA